MKPHPVHSALHTFSIAVLLLASASAFTHSPLCRTTTCVTQNVPFRSECMPLGSSKNDGKSIHTDDEFEEMENLIVSLSLEPTDESRRDRVATLFAEELAKPNGAPKKFTDLFASTLNVVGDRVRLLASEKVAEMEKEETESDHGDKGDEKKDQMKTVVSIPEGRQLWALVDMMVQSKTLLQSHTGKLGSKGTFQ